MVDGHARGMFWLVDDRLVASAQPGESYFWTLRPRRFTVRVVDDLGRDANETISVGAFRGQ